MPIDNLSGGGQADSGETGVAVDRRSLLQAVGGLSVGAVLTGQVTAQEAVVVALSDETVSPGEQATVSLTIEGDEEPETEIAGYDLGISYDGTLSFVEAHGVDMSDPVVNRNTGEIRVSATEPQGVPVELTAAEFVFTLEDETPPGEVATLTIPDGDLSDPEPSEVPFTTVEGSVTAGDGDNGSGDDGDGDDDDTGGNDGSDDDGNTGGDDGSDDGDTGGDDGSGDDGDTGDDDGSDDDGDTGGDDGSGDDGAEDTGDDGGDGSSDNSDDSSNGSGGSDETTDDSTAAGDGETDGSGDDGAADGFGPGFGVGSALAAIGGVGYMLRRRLTDGR